MGKMIFIILFSFLIFAEPSSARNNFLRIPLHASMISLDPSKVQDISSLWVSRQINCQLVRMKKGVPALELAQSIRYVTPVLLDVKIRSDIYFSDGSRVTAEDVVASFNYLRLRRTVLRNVFNWIEKIELKNKNELLIKLREPSLQFLTVISAPHYAVFKKSFILAVTKDPSLWKKPIGCGDYKLDKMNESVVELSPTKGRGLPVKFSLVIDSQLLANDLDKYDMAAMQLIGESNSLSDFHTVNIFDPFQYYFVLNTRIQPWNDRHSRCAFFSKINTQSLINIYAGRARQADDFLPSGTLGYVKNKNYMRDATAAFKGVALPHKQSICVSFVATSIEKNFRPAYLEMIRKIFPSTKGLVFKNYTDLNREIEKEKCDGTFYAAKSNYLDAYEYLVTFSEKGPSATGFHDEKLAKKIERSQDISQPDVRAAEYHSITAYIKKECLMYPLFTMPYDTAYVRNNLIADDIGEGAINEYLLSNVHVKTGE